MANQAVSQDDRGEETSTYGFQPKLSKQMIIGGAGVILILVGLIGALLSASGLSSEVEIIPASEMGATSEIVIDVAGAVQNPGVYRLKANCRLNDALVAAGGLSAEADRDWLAQNVNLAAPLKDGIKIYIRSTKDVKSTTSGDQRQVLSENHADTKININTASLAELDRLAGIGPVIAQRILDYRQQNGSFSKIEDLMQVSGIGQKVFDKIKDQITVW